MKRLSLFSVIFLLIISESKSQQQLSISSAGKIADSLYRVRNYKEATKHYLEIEKRLDFSSAKCLAFYNAACCLSLSMKTDSSILILKKAIEMGFRDRQQLESDADFKNLYNEPGWPRILKSINSIGKTANGNPEKVKIITSDIHNFWRAYEKANLDTLHYREIFDKYYFSKASIGMNDYMGLKVKTINSFINHIKSKPKFYSSIKSKTLQVDNYKSDFINAFRNLKEIYPLAQFPDIYFVIGAFTSGGTVSDAGLLIGLNQYCLDDDVIKEEISFNEKMIMGNFGYLKFVVPHELIHFQQGKLKNDTTTLSYAIREGMADFIGELISNTTAAPDLHVWAKGKEVSIWERFKIDMYFNRYDNWIANGRTSTPDNPQDQGYWIGYQICKSYYENMPDKKKAIIDMLQISDYNEFLRKSKWEEKILTFNK